MSCVTINGERFTLATTCPGRAPSLVVRAKSSRTKSMVNSYGEWPTVAKFAQTPPVICSGTLICTLGLWLSVISTGYADPPVIHRLKPTVGAMWSASSMTALADLHPDAGHPALAGAARAHELLDEVLAALEAAPSMTSGDYTTAVGEWARVNNRVQAVVMRLVASAEDNDVADLTGHPGTAPWLADQLHADGADAARSVHLARSLRSLPATAAALAQGDITPAHATVIADTDRRLGDSVSDEERSAIEDHLLTRASAISPRQLRKAARRALQALDRDRHEVDADEDNVLAAEERRARERTRLTFHDNGDGTLSGYFTVPILAGSILKKLVEQLASPRRGRLGASYAQAGDQGEAINWPRRYGEALIELIEHLPTDRLPSKVAATMLVNLDLDALRDGVKGCGLDVDESISAAEARRMACGAGLVPAVLDGASFPLDLGRSKRFFTEAHRVAGATRWSTCAADGCERPYAWTELHHRQPWLAGGATDLANMVPLCGFHHRRVHDPDFEHEWFGEALRFRRRR